MACPSEAWFLLYHMDGLVHITPGIHGTRKLGSWDLHRCHDPSFTLTRTTYLSIIVNPAHPCMETIFPDGCDLFQQHSALLPQSTNGLVMVWGNNEFQVLTWTSNSPRSQSNWASVGCAGSSKTPQQLSGHKDSANILVPQQSSY